MRQFTNNPRQISLAHFCEFHGPTSILCTQLSSVHCSSNGPGTPRSEDLSKSASSLKGYDSRASSVGDKHQNLHSPLETPPMSPRSPNGSHNPYFPRLPVDKDGQRQYSSGSGSASGSSSDTDYEDGCDSCSILVPKSMSDRLPSGAPGSPRQNGKGRHGSPVLRTTQHVTAPGSSYCIECDDSDSHSIDESQNTIRRNFGPKGTASPSDGGSSQGSQKNHNKDNNLNATNDSAVSSPLLDQPPSLHTHKHTLTYVSTRQPASPHAYSLLRRACIRTLSTENLPRGSRNGPLYFGDPVTGYTIAYIFRLTDPRSRGRQRQYALIALGGRDSWRVSKRYVDIVKAFEAIANTISNMADAVLERESNASTASSSRPGSSASALATSFGSSIPSITTSGPPTATTSPVKDRSDAAKSINTSPAGRTFTPVSSFLSAKKLDPDGYPRGTREAMKPKGLSELVGRDDFFVELHARFCVILSGLVGAP